MTKDIQLFIDHLPYRACFYDKALKLVYSNQQSDGSFFPAEDDAVLPDWIWQSLQGSPDHSLHFQVPTDAFETILMQNYQALYDTSGDFIGVYAYIQDLKPILASYLKDSGQAIVGWSDVTSGASISNGDFDD